MNNDEKEPDDPCQGILAFSETENVLIFNSKNNKVFVSIGFSSSGMPPIGFVFDSVTGPNLIKAIVLDQSLLDNIRRDDITDIRSASDMELVEAGTIALHLCMGTSRNRVTFGSVDNLAIPSLLGKIFFDKIMKSIHRDETKVVANHSPPVHISMVYDAKTEAKKNVSDIRHFIDQGPRLLMMPISGEPK